MASLEEIQAQCKVKDCANCKQSSLNCNGQFELWIREKCTVYSHVFQPYFDVTLGREVQSEREIKEYCAANNCIYAGDKELTQQAAQNKKENIERQNREFREGLTEKLMSINEL